MNCAKFILGLLFLSSLGCASMSPREVRSEEAKPEVTEESELSPAPESLSLGAVDTNPGNEVRVLSIDGVVERPDKQLEEDSGGLGARSKEGRNSSLGARSAVRGQKAKSRSAPQRMESSGGAKTTCGDVLGGDYWAERLRVDPALQSFFKLSPMHLSKYRSIGGSHRRRKNLRGCFIWTNPPVGSALWSKLPRKGLRSPTLSTRFNY